MNGYYAVVYGDRVDTYSCFDYACSAYFNACKTHEVVQLLQVKNGKTFHLKQSW